MRGRARPLWLVWTVYSGRSRIRLLRDPSAREHVGARVVDGVARDEAAGAPIFDREALGRDVADDSDVVAAIGEPGHLELEVVLVRPEPRHRIVGLRRAEDGGGRG